MNPEMFDVDLSRADAYTRSTAATRLRIAGPDGTRPALLTLIGELDGSEHEKLHEAVTTLAECRPGGEIALDATGLTFLDSGGVRALLMCRDQVRRAGGSLIVATAGPIPYQVLEITGLLDMFGMPRLVESPVTVG